jgi:trk system potassium uptake protein TrkH
VRVLLVLGVIGRLLRLFSLAFLPPLLLALNDGAYGDLLNFAVALAASFLCGQLLALLSPAAETYHRAEAMSVVAGAWLVVAHFAAIPYALNGLSPVDALFESMSGMTTTGATILPSATNASGVPVFVNAATGAEFSRAFFLWRAMTQWFGGIGVIALFVVVLPKLGIAGRQLFFAESSDVNRPVSPRIHESALRLWLLYATLTVVQAGLLTGVAGMTPYESVVHAMATLAAGGFSPHPESILGYDNAAAEWIFVVFMVLGGTSFTLQWKAFTSRPQELVRDGEFLFYFGSTAAGAIGVALVVAGGVPGHDELRAGFFQSASLISSTGFASVDYVGDPQWTDAARSILVAVMLVGGCAGSAAGGAKAIRHWLVIKSLGREITRVLHPYSVLPLRYGRRTIPQAILRAVFTLVALYLLTYFFVGLALVVLGVDLVTGFSAALACVGNIGPGFGAVGPMANFASLPTASKLILTAGMWLGRLEIVTVLALFHPDVWRGLQLRGRPRRLET